VLPQIPRDHEQRIKGFGFVTFEDFDSMDRAIRKVNGLLVRPVEAGKAFNGGQSHHQGRCFDKEATTAAGQQQCQIHRLPGPRSNPYHSWS
jgi:RNA recognition motif-containing protein